MKRKAIFAIATPNIPNAPSNLSIPNIPRTLLDGVGGAASLVGRSVSETARAAQFWSTVLAIWARYKVTQVRTGAAHARGNQGAVERLWKHRHAHEAQAIWRLCVDMRGFYVKAGQLIALQAFVPAVIREKLSQLHDRMPAMPASRVRSVISSELSRMNLNLDDVFSSLDLDSVLGSASIAQVHAGTLRRDGSRVAVKVQYPGGRRCMDKDLGNFQFLVGLLERTEMNFDLSSPVRELKRQIALEFDFANELRSMNEIRAAINGIGKSSVSIPYGYEQYSTHGLLVMQYMDGVPLTRLEEQLKHRNMSAARRRRFSRRILTKLARCYGEMVLTHGHFQADSHPGNVLVTNSSADLALLDFGQTKRFSTSVRKSFAEMVLAVARHDARAVDAAMDRLGIVLEPLNDGGRNNNRWTGAEMLAYTMFDTADVPGVSNNPFAEDSALKTISVEKFPPELFFLLRTVQIFKGIANASGNHEFSLAKHWGPMAKRALRK